MGIAPAIALDRSQSARLLRAALVEHGLNMNFGGIRLVSQLTIFQAHRRAANLDVALEREALLVGGRSADRRT